MADLTTLKTRLSEAESALHSLAIGARTAQVDVDGHRISYTQASVDKLQGYIVRLRAEIAAAGGTEADGARRRRALRPLVG